MSKSVIKCVKSSVKSNVSYLAPHLLSKLQCILNKSKFFPIALDEIAFNPSSKVEV